MSANLFIRAMRIPSALTRPEVTHVIAKRITTNQTESAYVSLCVPAKKK